MVGLTYFVVLATMIASRQKLRATMQKLRALEE
jgi:hypothetical protein